MAASSSNLAAVAPVVNPTSVLAAAVRPDAEIRWPTDLLLAFDMKAAAVIQQNHLDTNHLGGLVAFNEGFNSTFRMKDSEHGMGQEVVAVAFRHTQVLSHGLKMFEYRLCFCVFTYPLIVLLVFFLCCCYM